METLAWSVGMIAIIWCFSISARLKKVERILKEPQIRQEEDSMGQILRRHLGSCVILELEDDCSGDFDNTPCRILDADEQWVLLRQEKKGFEGLVRFRQIQSLQFVEE